MSWSDLRDVAAIIFSIAFAVPTIIASAAGGFILGSFALSQARKTVLGIHIRHWMTRHAPSKFFAEDFISDKARG